MTIPPLTAAQRTGQDRSILQGTRYHSAGGPTKGVPYRVAVQANTNFRSASVHSREFLCCILLADAARLPKLANNVPAQQCQKYIVPMLASWGSVT